MDFEQAVSWVNKALVGLGVGVGSLALSLAFLQPGQAHAAQLNPGVAQYVNDLATGADASSPTSVNADTTLYKVTTNGPSWITVERRDKPVSGHTDDNNQAILEHILTSLIPEPEPGAKFYVDNPFPNANDGIVNVRYQLPDYGSLKATLWNVLGQKAKEIIDDKLDPGNYELRFSMSKFARGMYFLTIDYNGKRITKKVTMLDNNRHVATTNNRIGSLRNPYQQGMKDSSGLDTARVIITPDDPNIYHPVDTTLVYPEPASAQDTVRLYLPMGEIPAEPDTVEYAILTRLVNGPDSTGKEYEGRIVFAGDSIGFKGRYGQEARVLRIGDNIPGSESIEFVVAGTDSIPSYRKAKNVDNKRHTDLGTYDIPWADFAPFIFPNAQDTVSFSNLKAEMYRDQNASDFNNNIVLGEIVSGAPEGLAQQYDPDTGKVEFTLPEGYDQGDFVGTVRWKDATGLTASHQVYFKAPGPVVTPPDTFNYNFVVELQDNGPDGSGRGLSGSLKYSNGDSSLFTGRYGDLISIMREGDSLPDVEDLILRVFASDSTEGIRDTLQEIVNSDSVDLGRFYDSWSNQPPLFDQQPRIMQYDEDTIGNNPFAASDFNKDRMSYSVNNLPDGWEYSFDGQTLNLKPPKDYYGTIDGVTITVSDRQETVESNPFSVTINPVNDAPVISMPIITMKRNGQTTLNLNNYVEDADNDPSEMSWQATGYDTSIVDIDIADSIAKITGKDRNGSTYVTWTATDPHNASDQKNAKVYIKFALKLIGQVYDGILDRGEPNIHVRLEGPAGIKDTLTGPDGRFAFYSKQAGNHTFTIVPNDTIMELEQVFEKLSDDYDMGKVGLTHADLPWIGYIHAQSAGVQVFGDTSAYNKHMADSLGLPDDPKTIPTFFIMRSLDRIKMKADIDSFNAQVDKGAAKYKLERPGRHNIIENTSTNAKEERQLWENVYKNGEDGRFVILVQYHDGGPSSHWNATSGGISDGPHLSTKAGADVYERWTYSVLYSEALAAMQNKSGEIRDYPDWAYTIYGGGGSMKKMESLWTYRNGIYFKEEMVDKMSNKVLTPGARTIWNRNNNRFKVIRYGSK